MKTRREHTGTSQSSQDELCGVTGSDRSLLSSAMRLAFLTSGRLVPSSRFRVLQFVPHLQRLGHECLVLPSRPEKYSSLPLLGFRLSGHVKRWHRRSDLVALERWSPDVVVLEREIFSDESFDVEQAVRRIAKRLVLDIDDGLFVLHRQKFEVLCGLSDHVIAGNELLATRVREINPSVTVIPTCVDLDRFGEWTPRDVNDVQNFSTFQFRFSDSLPQLPIRRSQVAILGWTGTAANIAYLEVLREPLKTLSREFPIELRVIAESDRPLRALAFDRYGIPTRFVRWSEETEVADLRQFEIGLMPMPDTEWTRYKCGLKILQYMAAGVPAVASPVGVNTAIIRNQITGWLASTPDEWLYVL
ncbi:MAG: group 1 glycosyl transferase, partial [Planctomycetota bacterium]